MSKKQQNPAKSVNNAFIDVEWSESMSGKSPPMVPKKVIHSAMLGLIWSADNNVVAVKPLTIAAIVKWVEKFAKKNEFQLDTYTGIYHC